MDASRRSEHPANRTGATALALVGVVGVLAYGLATHADAPAYDDAYFFKRFALNLLDHGVLAWNPSDGPVHGLSSQLFAVWSIALAALARDHFVLATRLSSLACLALTGLLLARASTHRRARFDGLLLALMALTTPVVATSVHSGMETALALLLTALALAVCDGRSATAAALATGALLACRPDAALLPAVAYLAGDHERREKLRFGLTLVALTLALALVAHAYYGSALPLPFLAKTAGLSPYGPSLRQQLLAEKLEHLATFAAFAAPLVWFGARNGGRDRRAVLAAALALVAYHVLFTHEIMGYRARFYAPALIALALVAARAPQRTDGRGTRRLDLAFVAVWGPGVAAAYAARWVAVAGPGPAAVPLAAYAGPVLAIAAVFATSTRRPGLQTAAALVPLTAGALLAWPPHAPRGVWDAAVLARAAGEVTTARGAADVARCLPPDVTVYHSEMGLVGLLLPRAHLTDVTGLLSADVARDPHGLAQRCARERPDAIFLPHRHYVGLDRQLRSPRCLDAYVRVVDRSSSPLYVRRDLAPGFLACAREVWRFQTKATRARLEAGVWAP